MYLILHNVRSVHNVGSIFRTAEAAGVEKIYITGITPAPTNRFGHSRKDLAKVALGAERMVAWERVVNSSHLIEKLKKKGIKIVALEQDSKSINYRDFGPHKPFALLLGNEVRGLPASILEKCDEIIEIPIRGKKESLNVSVAAGIALFKMIEQYQ